MTRRAVTINPLTAGCALVIGMVIIAMLLLILI